MATQIILPRVDMDMATGKMGRWFVKEGATVEKGQLLFEIETDKAAMEVDAPASGVLKFVAASEGDVLPVGACIGWILAEGESFLPPPPNARALSASATVVSPFAAGETNDGESQCLGILPKKNPANLASVFLFPRYRFFAAFA